MTAEVIRIWCEDCRKVMSTYEELDNFICNECLVKRQDEMMAKRESLTPEELDKWRCIIIKSCDCCDIPEFNEGE